MRYKYHRAAKIEKKIACEIILTKKRGGVFLSFIDAYAFIFTFLIQIQFP